MSRKKYRSILNDPKTIEYLLRSFLYVALDQYVGYSRVHTLILLTGGKTRQQVQVIQLRTYQPENTLLITSGQVKICFGMFVGGIRITHLRTIGILVSTTIVSRPIIMYQNLQSSLSSFSGQILDDQQSKKDLPVGMIRLEF